VIAAAQRTKTMFPTALAIALFIIGTGYAVHSLWLGLTLAHPMPFGDQLVFVRDYFKYLDGTYAWSDLLSQHNEHRIITTRIVLFADAILFRMRGLLPIAVTYASLGTAALLGARLIAQPGLDRLAASGLALGLLWSTSQWLNLTWQFNIQFIFVHLCGFVCLIALWRASRFGSAAWIALAVAADGIAVASLGSGILLIAPILLLGLWLRSGRPVAILAAFHALFTGLYFTGYHWPVQSSSYLLDAGTIFRTAVEYVGTAAGKHEFFVGLGGIVLLAVLAVHISWLVISRKPVDEACCVFAAIAGFSAVEALVVGYTRGSWGIHPRYATASVFFWAALLGAVWRMTQKSRMSLVVPAIAVVMVIVMNAPRFEASWREQNNFLSIVTRDARHDTFNPAAMQRLYEHPWTPQVVARLRDLGLGPFAPGR
jgi:hypothetical protein